MNSMQQNQLPSWVSEDDYENDQELSQMNISYSMNRIAEERLYHEREIDREYEFNQTPRCSIRHIIAPAL